MFPARLKWCMFEEALQVAMRNIYVVTCISMMNAGTFYQRQMKAICDTIMAKTITAQCEPLHD